MRDISQHNSDAVRYGGTRVDPVKPKIMFNSIKGFALFCFALNLFTCEILYSWSPEGMNGGRMTERMCQINLLQLQL